MSIEGNTYRVLREILTGGSFFPGSRARFCQLNGQIEIFVGIFCAIFFGTVPIVKVIFGKALKISGKTSINRAESLSIIKICQIRI